MVRSIIITHPFNPPTVYCTVYSPFSVSLYFFSPTEFNGNHPYCRLLQLMVRYILYTYVSWIFHWNSLRFCECFVFLPAGDQRTWRREWRFLRALLQASLFYKRVLGLSSFSSCSGSLPILLCLTAVPTYKKWFLSIMKWTDQNCCKQRLASF